MLESRFSLRYAAEVVEYAADPKPGKLAGCLVYGPASEHERNPGLFHYGIHAVEAAIETDMTPANSWNAATDDPDQYASAAKRSKVRLLQLMPLRPLL